MARSAARCWRSAQRGGGTAAAPCGGYWPRFAPVAKIEASARITDAAWLRLVASGPYSAPDKNGVLGTPQGGSGCASRQFPRIVHLVVLLSRAILILLCLYFILQLARIMRRGEEKGGRGGGDKDERIVDEAR